VEELAGWLKPKIESHEPWEEEVKIEKLRQWASNKQPSGFNYKTFTIPKRNGGQRTIEAPNENLKLLQKRIYLRILKNLKVHPSCVGFMREKSIADAARPHTNKEVVINLDLKDFFTLTSSKRIEGFFRKIGWGRSASRILTNICTYGGRLPQGAPTSPMLTNALNYQMDNRMEKLATRLNGNYTRYADDLTFSFKQYKYKNRLILKLVPKILRDYGYEIQKKKKVRVIRQHQRQTVVGLVVNQKVNWPRDLRRKIRAMEHQLKIGRIDKYQSKKVNGYASMLSMIKDKQSTS
jgi:retron-type reverse transcriptase